MGINRDKIRLNIETSKNSVNTDSFVKINMESTQRLLPTNEINEIVDVAERFEIERQRSKYYRVLGTINLLATNALFNTSYPSNASWTYLNDNIFLDGTFSTSITYEESIKRNLRENNGWFGFYDPDPTKFGLCKYIDMEPKRQRFSFVSDRQPFGVSSPVSSPTKNWEITITYPKFTEKNHNLIKGGLLIIDASQAIVSNRVMTQFTVPCLHNLQIGSVVKIEGTTGYDGEYVVVRTGDDNGDLKEYIFVIDKPLIGVVSNNSRMTRIVNGIESEYYFRKFVKVPTRISTIIETDDYEAYKLSFNENVYGDDLTQFVFNEDINLSGLTDNLGRPISEMYITIIKTDSNGLFTPVSSGIETPFIPRLNNSITDTYLRDVPVINKIHNGGLIPTPTHTPLEININVNNASFFGDVVEYNTMEVKETILAEVAHRFNTLNRETTTIGSRQEGYYYKPHNKIKIREYSSYVEQGDNLTVGIPDYAVDIGDGRFLWRDLLDIGFNESSDEILDYPFLNGCHYIYDNLCLYLKRQDPFSEWGLFHSTFPADPIGNTMSNNFTTNTSDDVC